MRGRRVSRAEGPAWPQVFEAFPQPVLVVAPDSFRIVAANASGRAEVGGAQTCHAALHGRDSPCAPTGHDCPVVHVTQTWVPYTCEVVRGQGQSARILEVTAFPVRGESGQVGWVGLILRDITELRKREHELLSHERLRAAGDLARVVAHRFNNVLQVVVSGTQVALVSLAEGRLGEVRATLEDVLSCVGKATQTVAGLSQSAVAGAPGGGDQEVCDLSLAVAKTLAVLAPDRGGTGGALVEPTLRSGVLVRASREDLARFLSLLVGEVVERAGRDAPVRVETGVDAQEAVVALGTPKPIPEAGATVVRREDGSWVPSTFATLGSLAARVGGRLAVSHDQGTRWEVRFPLVTQGDRRPGAAALSFLVVDDNREVLASLEDGLRARGHVVWTAASGEAALSMLAARPVDAIICDYAMPGMDGVELAGAVEDWARREGKERPAFVLLTGWISDQTRAKALERGADEVVLKPVEPSSLAEMVASLVERRRARPS